LLLLNYFAANLDNWDPKVTNGLAADRDVILIDYPGIGGSSGQTASTVATLTTDCVEFCRALNLTHFDVVGFSLGGMIAQQLSAEYPEMIRRIILLGTGPRGGEGLVFDPAPTRGERVPIGRDQRSGGGPAQPGTMPGGPQSDLRGPSRSPRGVCTTAQRAPAIRRRRE
jgi:pimeloyl-ACP methyl ester carboxylesterase